MRAVFAILCGLFVCGVIAQSLDSHLPAQWGTIVGAVVGLAVGLGIYRWRVSR
jgi:high-affinity Fe2+/Pb2+ permease